MQMWLTFAVIAAAITLFATEWIALEVTALGVVIALLLLFHLYPLADAVAVSPQTLLSGFANPALFAILALLVIGQGLHQTGVMEEMSRRLVSFGRWRGRMLVWLVIVGAGGVSAFMNNTPVVVIFIPIVAILADRFGPGAGKVLMPLSFVTILGGMTTLIGSSTNLLVAGVAGQQGITIGFFDLMMPGILLALVGTLYAIFVVPRVLQPEGADKDQAGLEGGRQFLAQIDLGQGHALVGMTAVSGLFPALREATVLMIDRGGQRLLPPFEDVTLMPGDAVVVAATRSALTALLRLRPDSLNDETGEASPAEATGAEIVLAEAAVAPGSRLEGRRFDTNNFRRDTGCSVLGVQRHRRMQRSLLGEIRLAGGDVLLIVGPRARIRAIRADRDLLVLGGTLTHLPAFASARVAIAIFIATVSASALGVLPILHAALIGGAAMIFTGCLDVRQAVRAIDRQIVMLIGASIAMAMALDATGGAHYLATTMVATIGHWGPLATLSALFLLVACLTNLLSNNATALLFTPIAISTASELGQDAIPFLHAVIYAANCSFATPIGYQTNLLVMGPGNYRFADFFRAGIPLLIILWLVFTMVASLWYPL